MTYLITFAGYGCHLHGQEPGSVDRRHNLFGSRLLDHDPERVYAEQRRMDQSPYSMDGIRRDVVLAARTNHIHIEFRRGSSREDHE